MEMDNHSDEKSVDDEEDCPTESDNDSEMEMDNHSGKSKRAQKSSSASKKNQRIKELRSRNPPFSVTMKPSYLVIATGGASYMHIPKDGARYFRNNITDDVELMLKEGNGKVWFIKYRGGSSSYTPRIGYGWREFSEENNLKIGDICTFEPISTTGMKFKVTISRKIDGEEVDKRKEKGRKKPANVERIRKRKRDSSAEEEHSFTVKMTKTSVQDNCRLCIPIIHSARYLHDQDGKEVVLRADGKECHIMCHTYDVSTRFYGGWKDFVVQNDLQVGDTCVFELCSRKSIHYNVTISSG